MVAALTVRRGDATTGNVKAKLEAVHIQVTGADPAVVSYILADAPVGQDDLRSHVFAPSSDGKHVWNEVIFPTTGAWTLRLRKLSDNSDLATAAVTVS